MAATSTESANICPLAAGMPVPGASPWDSTWCLGLALEYALRGTPRASSNRTRAAQARRASLGVGAGEEGLVIDVADGGGSCLYPSENHRRPAQCAAFSPRVACRERTRGTLMPGSDKGRPGNSARERNWSIRRSPTKWLSLAMSSTRSSALARHRSAGRPRDFLQRRKPAPLKLLAGTMAGAGLRYTHLRGLGTPKPGRDAARKATSPPSIASSRSVCRRWRPRPPGPRHRHRRRGRRLPAMLERDHTTATAASSPA